MSTTGQIEAVRRAEIYGVMRLIGWAPRRESRRGLIEEEEPVRKTNAYYRQLERALHFDNRRNQLRKDWNRMLRRAGIVPLSHADWRDFLRRSGGQAAVRAELEAMQGEWTRPARVRRVTPTNNAEMRGPQPSALTQPPKRGAGNHHRDFWPTRAEKADYRAWVVDTLPTRGATR